MPRVAGKSRRGTHPARSVRRPCCETLSANVRFSQWLIFKSVVYHGCKKNLPPEQTGMAIICGGCVGCCSPVETHTEVKWNAPMNTESPQNHHTPQPHSDAVVDTSTDAPFALEVLYDGDCPLCHREVTWLRKLDRRQRLRWTNIASNDFRCEDYGRSMEQLMGALHMRLPDASLVTGVEAFRQMYSAVGFGWLIALTRLPGVSHLMEWSYRLFARNRLRLTGRCHSQDTCRTPPSHGTDADS